MLARASGTNILFSELFTSLQIWGPVSGITYNITAGFESLLQVGLDACCRVIVNVLGHVPFIILIVLSANIYTSMERLQRRLTLKGRWHRLIISMQSISDECRHEHLGQVPLVPSARLEAEKRRKVFRTKRQSTGSNNQAKECNLAFVLMHHCHLIPASPSKVGKTSSSSSTLA